MNTPFSFKHPWDTQHCVSDTTFRHGSIYLTFLAHLFYLKFIYQSWKKPNFQNISNLCDNEERASFGMGMEKRSK